ncbi:MAG: adenylosuccinate lyase [Chlamydiales bacterium]|nr:adenylosuccinate lyase [Chlamydiales bacterium]
MFDGYESPLASRYSSDEMQFVFSNKNKYLLWRKLWVALAEAQKNAGLNITQKQIDNLIAFQDHISFEQASIYEAKTHHEVMAHILAYGDVAKEAKSIIHLGATSSYVIDNGDLIQIKEGLFLLQKKLFILIKTLADFCNESKHIPCVGYTHFQPAQPTTVGKRASLWLQDLVYDFKEMKILYENLPFLGLKGATGSQASFMELFDQDTKKIDSMEKEIAKAFDFQKIIPIASQTYPRKWDVEISNRLESLAASLHKMGSDLRLLSHLDEVTERFDKDQVGSSAMPHKKNPIYSERLCAISRFVISLAQNAAHNASQQWLERTLDDSANRRLFIPEIFLSTDAILEIAVTITKKLHINHKTIQENLSKHLPELALENMLMIGVKKGFCRQTLHESLRKAYHNTPNHLPDTIYNSNEIPLTKEEVVSCFDPIKLTGRCEKQVSTFLTQDVYPLLNNAQIQFQ